MLLNIKWKFYFIPSSQEEKAVRMMGTQLLKVNHKRNRMTCSKYLLKDIHCRLMTVGKTWIHYYGTWGQCTFQMGCSKKRKTGQQEPEDRQGGCFLNCASLFDHLKIQLQEERPELAHNNVHVHNDGELAHFCVEIDILRLPTCSALLILSRFGSFGLFPVFQYGEMRPDNILIETRI